MNDIIRYAMTQPTNADAYTVAGNCLVSSEAKERSTYYLANRYSPMKAWPHIARDDRMVFWGLSQYIDDNLRVQVTHKDILDAMRFMDQARVGNKPLKFDYKMWQRVVEEYNGYLPISIEGLPEGSVFYPHQPMVQVTSLGKGFGEIAAHVEVILVGQVADLTAHATLRGHWYEHIVSRMMLLGYDEAEARLKARDYITDFGMRAYKNKQHSLGGGLAHLFFFNGTDIFNAAFKAFQDGVTDAGKSILALAHRTVQSYENESDAYRNLYDQDDVGSYVGDCYDYERAVDKDLAPLAKLSPDKTIVARPDSGDAIDNGLYLCRKAESEGLFTAGRFGLKNGTNLRMIEGNSITPVTMDERDDALIAAGYNPYEWGLYGVGGYFPNNCTRDSLSSAYKLNSVGVKRRPVMKISLPGKESIPGPIQLVDGICEIRPRSYTPALAEILPVDCQQRLVTYYYGGDTAKWVGNYKDAYDRLRNGWTNAPKSISRETIVAPVQDIINGLYKRYKG